MGGKKVENKRKEKRGEREEERWRRYEGDRKEMIERGEKKHALCIHKRTQGQQQPATTKKFHCA